MADDGTKGFDEGIAGLDELIQHYDEIQRDALKAAAEAVKPQLVKATPEQTGEVSGTSLPPGTLKASVRTRIGKNRSTGKPIAILDFGKYSWIAWCVERGHKPPNSKLAKKLNKQISGKNTPAHPFIRPTEDASRDTAEKAFKKAWDDGIHKALKGKK